jgi:hypothetical protein
MKIFVGWPYDAEWVEKYALPLIETYGFSVLTGKELQGKPISEGVKDKLKEADAALFFTSRRGEPNDEGLYATSDWVRQEIAHANSLEKSTILEVRDNDIVDYPNNLHPERQRINVDPGDRIKCLVELGKAITGWRGQSLKLKLLPLQPSDKQFFSDELRLRLRQDNYKCSYRVRQKYDVIHGPKVVRIVREDFDYYIYTDELPASFFNSQDMYLEVDVVMGDNQWSCLGIRPNVLEAPLENLARLQRQPDGSPS